MDIMMIIQQQTKYRFIIVDDGWIGNAPFLNDEEVRKRFFFSSGSTCTASCTVVDAQERV